MTVVSKKILEQKPAQSREQNKLKIPRFLAITMPLFIFFLAFGVVYFTFLNTSDSQRFDEIVEKLAKNIPLFETEKSFFCEYLSVRAGTKDCEETLAAYQKKLTLWSESDINEKIFLLKNLPFLTDEDKILLQELEAETDKKGSEVNFEDTEKLCRDFGAYDMHEFHQEIKPQLKKKTLHLVKRFFEGKEHNPDFGLSKRGFIVIRSVKSKKTINTGEKY
jgi:hypothetical protein